MSKILIEAGVLYTHEPDLAEEHGGKRGTYHWLHIPSGNKGERDVWVFTDVVSFGMNALLNHWNRADEWKYWSD